MLGAKRSRAGTDTLQLDARCPPQLGGSRPAQRHSLCSPQLDNNCPAQLDNCPAQLDSAQHSWIPLPGTSCSPNPRVLWELLAPCSACEGPTALTGSPSFPVPGCCGSHAQPDDTGCRRLPSGWVQQGCPQGKAAPGGGRGAAWGRPGHGHGLLRMPRPSRGAFPGEPRNLHFKINRPWQPESRCCSSAGLSPGARMKQLKCSFQEAAGTPLYFL